MSETTAAKKVGLNLYQRLLAVQKAVAYFQQNQSGDRFKYVASGEVLTKIREAMDEAGVILAVSVVDAQLHLDAAYSGKQHFTELTIELVWINPDNPEERLAWRMYGQGIDSGEKGVGKALTYAEKYGLLKFFHIATGKHDDPDADQEDHGNGHASEPTPAPTKRPAPAPAVPGDEERAPAAAAQAPATPGEFSNPGELFTALMQIGCGPADRDRIRASLGIETPWPGMGPSGYAKIYAAAQAEKGGQS